MCDKTHEYEAEFHEGDDYYQDIREIFRSDDSPDDDCRDFHIITSNDEYKPDNCKLCWESCLTFEQIKKYIGEECFCFTFFGWHISDFKIYDKPRELSDFRTKCRHYDDGLCGDCKYYDYANNESYRCEECAVDGFKPITRPPQSWCYVEEREENA